jgi:excisionase family DNA binding protein
VDNLITTKQLAEYLNLSEQVLYLWRKQKKGPPYITVGAKFIRYRKNDVEEWITNNNNEPRSSNE